MIINFMIISKSHHQREAKEYRFISSWSPSEDLTYTMSSATSNCSVKNYPIKIEFADLEDEAKTTQK